MEVRYNFFTFVGDYQCGEKLLSALLVQSSGGGACCQYPLSGDLPHTSSLFLATLPVPYAPQTCACVRTRIKLTFSLYMTPKALVPFRLYSPLQVGVSTLIGSPLAGFWLIALNYRALGDKKREMYSYIWALGGTVAVIVIAYVIVDIIPFGITQLAYTLVIYFAAKRMLGKLVEEHSANGGSTASWWEAARIGAAGFVVVYLSQITIGFISRTQFVQLK